jgi:hypothetical protein
MALLDKIMNVGGLVVGVWDRWKKWRNDRYAAKAKKRIADAKKLASDLKRIRKEAGTDRRSK